MSLSGRRLIIVGAQWSDVSIGKLHASIASTSITASGTTTISCWAASDVVSPAFTVVSSSTSVATVGATPTGSGTQADPYVYTISGVANGSTTLTVTLTGTGLTTETKTFTLTVGSTPVTTYSVSAGTLTNCTVSSWPTGIASGGTATVTVTPTSGYSISAVSIGSGTAGTPTYSGTTVTIPNITSNVTLNVTCESVFAFEQGSVRSTGGYWRSATEDPDVFTCRVRLANFYPVDASSTYVISYLGGNSGAMGSWNIYDTETQPTTTDEKYEAVRTNSPAWSCTLTGSTETPVTDTVTTTANTHFLTISFKHSTGGTDAYPLSDAPTIVSITKQ